MDGTDFISIYDFSGADDGANPNCDLIQGNDGRLYGTTANGGIGGVGTVFSVNPDGTGYVMLHSFSGGGDGAHLYGGLVQGDDGRLYGTTFQGGINGYGTVFALNTDGTGFTVLHSFSDGDDGGHPQAALIQSGDGRLYGTAVTGGAIDRGTVFSMETDGTGF